MFLILFALSPSPSALSQIPQGFNYQAIARDAGTGNPITDPIDVKIAILADDSPEDVLWEEKHTGVDPDDHGLFSIVVGGGVYESGPVLTFGAIDWSVTPKYIRTQIYYGGSWKNMGSAQLWAVPYSMVAKDVEGPVEKLGIEGTTTNNEEALFEVRNRDGQTVFAVYNEGIRAYVNEIDAKGAKGGFAIGSFGTTKEGEEPQDLLFVSGDSVRVYIDNVDLDPIKGPKGGFAIGGFGTAKAGPQKFLTVSNDSVRIYVDNNETDKGPKGGFAIGGYGTDKGKPQKLLTVSNDSVRIYINDGAKGPKGGFAIGGFDQSKGSGGNVNFFNVETDNTGIVSPAEPRILWYPLKNAFMAGQVLILKPDSVGMNSVATGFESRAKGAQSQAMGYQAIARGDYSTAIGKNALARKANSFAFGDAAKAYNQDSYAFGAYAEAQGLGSFAFGYVGRDSLGPTGTVTRALGDYSFAYGLGAQAIEEGSIAMGSTTESSGKFSTAIGYGTYASGPFSTSIGFQNTASGRWSTAIGVESNATGYYSMVLGWEANSSGNTSLALNRGTIATGSSSVAMNRSTTAAGHYSTSMGVWTTAQAYGSLVIGQCNVVSGDPNVWNPNDPAFVIGNGNLGAMCFPSNAFTVLKNGKTAVGHAAPTQMLDVNGQVRIRGGSPAAGKILTASDADGNATWEALPSHSHSAADITSGSLTVARGGTGLSTLTAGKVLVGNGTGTILTPTNLHWDNGNSRLGISNTSPTYNIDVTGTLRTTSTTRLASLSGNVGIGTTNTTNMLEVGGTARISESTYLATLSGGVGIGTTSAGSYKMSVLSSGSGPSGATCHFENTNSAGIALIARSFSTDGTALFLQEDPTASAGYSLRCDGYDPNWFVAFTVKGRNVGIGTGSPGQRLDIIGGNGRVESGYSWLTNSDVRYKKNITELRESLEKVMDLRGVRYDLAEDESVIDGEGKHIGFIAQELEQVFPEFVVTGDDGYKAVAYDKIGPVLVEAIKEQQEQIEQLKAIVAGMKEEIASLRSQ